MASYLLENDKETTFVKFFKSSIRMGLDYVKAGHYNLSFHSLDSEFIALSQHQTFM